jgi:hypothetical protein
MEVFAFFHFTLQLVVVVFLPIRTYHDKLLDRVRGGNNVEDLKTYFKWFGYFARKRPDWLLLISTKKSLEWLEFVTNQFDHEYIRKNITTLAFRSFDGPKDPVLEQVYDWSENEDMYEHAFHLENKYGVRVEDHIFFDATHDRYTEWRTVRNRRLVLEGLNAS